MEPLEQAGMAAAVLYVVGTVLVYVGMPAVVLTIVLPPAVVAGIALVILATVVLAIAYYVERCY